MSRQPWPASQRRIFATVLSAAIHVAVLAALLLWQFAPTPRATGPALTVVDLSGPPPPEPLEPPSPPPRPAESLGSAKAGAAAPPGPKVEAAPLASAIPVVVPSFAPAPVPSTGVAANSGAASSGTGTGAGGSGSGTGGGGSGDGNGGGRGAGEGTPPKIIRGDFKPSDYPKSLRQGGPSGRTWTEVMVAVNGRPVSCRVTRSSGAALLDTETCRIIMQRFRFRPGRDAAKRPVLAPFYIDIEWEYVDLNAK